jgi:hypothetical protein
MAAGVKANASFGSAVKTLASDKETTWDGSSTTSVADA